LKIVASLFLKGALKVEPKHGPPPLRWSWTSTGPDGAQVGHPEGDALPATTIFVLPSVTPWTSVSFFKPGRQWSLSV
jgi:hypothetical protein